MLKIYSTLLRHKQTFIPINPVLVSMYVCGITVYDYCHIGHARTCIFFDTVARYFMYLGYQVNLVRNITDVDDKILIKAQQRQSKFTEIASEFTAAMHADFVKLNLLPPTAEPKATDYIIEMIRLIEQLLARDYAYIGANGDVFYNINKFNSYGKLANRELLNVQYSERLDPLVQASKRNNQDFVLWKVVAEDEVGWESPWGRGRPGWHTECAAMSLDLFEGKTFDIHGGGADLLFPHHCNELAQVEAITKQNFVNHWMHVGLVQLSTAKMSKSLGNSIFIKDLLQQCHPEVLRLFILTTHYRSPIEFQTEKLTVAKNSLERLYLALRGVEYATTVDVVLPEFLMKFVNKFKTAMDDDFNTPLALTVLFELAKELNILKENLIPARQNLSSIATESDLDKQVKLAASTLGSLGNVLGLLSADPYEFLQQDLSTNQAERTELAITDIEVLILQRQQARLAKDWNTADRIRAELLTQGVLLEDLDNHTNWRRI